MCTNQILQKLTSVPENFLKRQIFGPPSLCQPTRRFVPTHEAKAQSEAEERNKNRWFSIVPSEAFLRVGTVNGAVGSLFGLVGPGAGKNLILIKDAELLNGSLITGPLGIIAAGIQPAIYRKAVTSTGMAALCGEADREARIIPTTTMSWRLELDRNSDIQVVEGSERIGPQKACFSHIVISF